jgi:putative membrane protein
MFCPLVAQVDLPGIDGFLGTRASLMLDVVFLAMFVVLPALAFSIYLVKCRAYDLHKKLQLLLGIVLLIAVVAFEIDMRLTGWQARAEASPYFDSTAKWSCLVGVSLLIHLSFAIPTALIWIYVIVQALRKFPSPVKPNAYSATHKFWAWLATFEMFMTAITGWVFYYLAFVCTKL